MESGPIFFCVTVPGALVGIEFDAVVVFEVDKVVGQFRGNQRTVAGSARYCCHCQGRKINLNSWGETGRPRRRTASAFCTKSKKSPAAPAAVDSTRSGRLGQCQRRRCVLRYVEWRPWQRCTERWCRR